MASADAPDLVTTFGFTKSDAIPAVVQSQQQKRRQELEPTEEEKRLQVAKEKAEAAHKEEEKRQAEVKAAFLARKEMRKRLTVFEDDSPGAEQSNLNLESIDPDRHTALQKSKEKSEEVMSRANLWLKDFHQQN
eukprot:m.262266 g.262266  ORF g.262266 m.262266 type:complete len:134 (-) comp16222_c1_seq11:1871-2272(-)